jgi:hypothetical protein
MAIDILFAVLSVVMLALALGAFGLAWIMHR